MPTRLLRILTMSQGSEEHVKIRDDLLGYSLERSSVGTHKVASAEKNLLAIIRTVILYAYVKRESIFERLDFFSFEKSL